MLQPRGTRSPRSEATSCLVGVILLVTLGLGESGCVALVVGAAGGVAGAVYVMGKLKDELPQDVPTVHRAVLAALTDLELKPSEDRADKVSAHVESSFADGERVWIDLDTVPESRTSLTIRVGLTGNEMRARRIHEAITRHLPIANAVFLPDAHPG